jgi:hypothetical protein
MMGVLAHVPKTNKAEESVEEMIVVHRISTEKRICIPQEMKPHLLELIAKQSNEWDDEHLQHDVE